MTLKGHLSSQKVDFMNRTIVFFLLVFFVNLISSKPCVNDNIILVSLEQEVFLLEENP